jgi:hypothetical protein
VGGVRDIKNIFTLQWLEKLESFSHLLLVEAVKAVFVNSELVKTF